MNTHEIASGQARGTSQRPWLSTVLKIHRLGAVVRAIRSVSTIVSVAMLATPGVSLADDIAAGQSAHLFDFISGIAKADGSAPESGKYYCAAPGTDIYVISVDAKGNAIFDVTQAPNKDATWYAKVDPKCVGISVSDGQSYTYSIAKSALQYSRVSTQGYVVGVLAIPYKWHLSDHASTAGTSLGGYVGDKFVYGPTTVTLIAGGGLALVSTASAQISALSGTTTGTVPATSATSASQTSVGFTLASGFVGTVGNTNSQVGLVVGIDWLGKQAHYQYEGKPWIAFEVGYNFLTTK
jgi:hypothetical protein